MSTLQSNDCQNNDSNDLHPLSSGLRAPDNSLTLLLTGFFNGFNVELQGCESLTLYNMGCFGKGSSSRSRPVAEREFITMRKRQFQKRNEWHKRFSSARVQPKPDLFLQAVDRLTAKVIRDGAKQKNKDLVDLVSSDESSFDDDDDEEDWDVEDSPINTDGKENIAVVVPNSDSENEDLYFENLKAECCIDQTKMQEKLILSLQEAFFLIYALGCLQIIDIYNHILNIEDSWKLFVETDRKFIPKYVVYHYYKSKNFIVKSGIKFGGDYLLYFSAPEYAHSEYIVVVKSENEKADWISTLGHIRMANTTAKEIIIAEVVAPLEPRKMPEGLNYYSVRETVLIRNIGTINEAD